MKNNMILIIKVSAVYSKNGRKNAIVLNFIWPPKNPRRPIQLPEWVHR